MFKKLSIIMPCYNEEKTLTEIVKKTLKDDLRLKKELILVNDGSTDKSNRIIQNLKKKYKNLLVITNKKNHGKGYCIKKGLKFVKGDLILIQDADLEYDPSDYKNIIKPILAKKTEVVFGSRFLSSESHNVLSFWHSIGNKMLTLLADMLHGLYLTDTHACYKCFTKNVIKKLKLKENGFAFDPEITFQLAKLKYKIYEVAINYEERGYKDGKKIKIRDLFRALWVILNYGIIKKLHIKN